MGTKRLFIRWIIVKFELVPGRKKDYRLVKVFEHNLQEVVKKVTRICGKRPVKLRDTGDVTVYTFPCTAGNEIVVDMVVTKKGITIYVSAPAIDKMDYTSGFVATGVGASLGFITGLFSPLAGMIIGIASYFAVFFGVRKYLYDSTTWMKKYRQLESL